MPKTDVRHQSHAPFSFLKNAWIAFAILLLGLVVTLVSTLYIRRSVDDKEKNEFALVCNELVTKIDLRLHAHAELLRSCSSFFMASDTVTRVEWKSFIGKSKLEDNLPGVQGVGYTCIIAKNQLQQHLKTIRGQGFPDYTIKPEGERDIYTSIVYIEPFAGRNLSTFGYDMFADPVRRKAMEQARDNDMATLSGKVQLVQETYRDVQAGALMYVPIYRNGKPATTLAERRAAIVGWVYSPYRMNDLMYGILGRWDSHDDNRIDLKVYDTDSISDNTLLFDSHPADSVILYRQPSSTLAISVNFNGTVWSLCFSQLEPDLAFYESEVYMVFICGVMISLLLFALALSLIHTKTRAERMAQQLTSELKQSETKFKTVADYTYDWEYWIGADNQLIYMSPSCERISGYKPEEFFADPLLLKKIVHPNDSSLFDEHLATIHGKEHSHDHAETNFRILKKAGPEVYIEHLCTPVYDEMGVYIGRRISNRDITEAQRSQDLVAQTRRNYETFFNTIDEFLFVLDQQGNMIHTNSTVIDRLGFTWAELKGQSVLMVHPPERRDEAGRIVGLMLQRKADFCPVPLITKSGMQIPVETRVTAGMWDGKPAIFGVTKDVSQIRLSQEKFSKLFHLNPSAAGLSDLVTGEYLEVNEAFYTLLGFDANEVIGKTASSLGILTDQTRTSIFRKADILGNISNLEADLIAKNGDIKRVLLSAENIYIQDKKYRFTVVHDITEWKKAEKEKEELLGRLQKTSELLHEAQEIGNIGSFSFDVVNDVHTTSPQMDKIFGFHTDFAKDAGAWSKTLYPDDREAMVSFVADCLEKGIPYDRDYRIIRDGQMRWIRGIARAEMDPAGNVARISGINIDITERKLMDEALQVSSRKFEAIIAASPDGIGIVSLDGKMKFLSTKLATMNGYTFEEKDELLGKSVLDFIDPSEHTRMTENILKLLSGKKNQMITEYLAIKKDNSRFHIDVNSTLLYDSNGNAESILFLERDITERKQAEDELKEASTRLLLATRAGGVGVWDLDVVNNVLVWDEQMFALYGITKHEFGGAYEAWLTGVHPDYKAQGDTEIQMAINGEKEFDTEFKVLWPDGSVHDIRALAVVQRDSSGNPLRMIGTNWDITQQKQTEAEINLQNEKLQKLNAEKDKFFSVIAHDLRSPFNGFLGLTKLLSEGATAYSPSEIKTVATSMRKSALALFGLLENLLDWSRMQRGLIPFDPTTLQLLPEAENCIALLHEAALVKRIEVSCFILPGLKVFASSNMLQSVIRNLLSNAIKFTPLGGTISVFAKPVKDNKIEVAIKDTGIGMNEEIISNLFELGLSTSRRGTEGEASTGLGLYLCKDFIEKQGGNLWAESREGSGSTFRFTVPVG